MSILRTLIISILLSNFCITLSGQIELDGNQSNISADYAVGGNFFLGQGLYHGSIAKYFSNPFYFGLNIEFYKKKFVFQFEDYIGFGRIKRNLNANPNTLWQKDNLFIAGMINLNVGYAFMDNETIMFVPLAGVGFNKHATNFDELYDFSNHLKPVIPHIKFGGYIDFRKLRVFRKNSSFNSNDGSYTCGRISFGYHHQIGEIKLSDFYGGNQFYLTLGIGGLGKL